MKNILVKTAAIALAVMSSAAFADKVMITGEPVMLEKQGELYVVPQTYQVRSDYQYVNIDGEKRACFLEKRPDFGSLDVVSINVQVGADKATWNCYKIDQTYFEMK